MFTGAATEGGASATTADEMTPDELKQANRALIDKMRALLGASYFENPKP